MGTKLKLNFGMKRYLNNLIICIFVHICFNFDIKSNSIFYDRQWLPYIDSSAANEIRCTVSFAKWDQQSWRLP